MKCSGVGVGATKVQVNPQVNYPPPRLSMNVWLAFGHFNSCFAILTRLFCFSNMDSLANITLLSLSSLSKRWVETSKRESKRQNASRIIKTWVKTAKFCVQNFKNIWRLLLPLAYVFFRFIIKYYYKNRLISTKHGLRFLWKFGIWICKVIRGCIQKEKKFQSLI